MTEYFDLGAHTRPVTTNSPDAQTWFDRGLLWCFGFNHEEAIRCFLRAAQHDPDCAMAYWGAAYAAGCNYNHPWEAFGPEELKAAVVETRRMTEAALARLAHTTPAERALILALGKRYPVGEVVSKEEFLAWNDNFAAAMREVYAAFPDDLDIAALFAEALINRTPWQLWNLETNEAAEGADTLEAMAVLERAMRQADERNVPHPGVLHMYLHTMEMSPHPEKALRAADQLRDLTPDAGHLRHMPSHIDILCGHYYNALVANEKAVAVDRKYLEREGPLNFYTGYRCHDIHFRLYAAMFLGQSRAALDAAHQLSAAVPDELLRIKDPPLVDWMEGFVSMKLHALVRFGRWQAILDEPLPADPEVYCVTTAMMHYARGIAHAVRSEIAEAEAERARFHAAWALVPDSRVIFNNKCNDVLAIAAEMLAGELAYRKAEIETAFDSLRKAVSLSDHLQYDEPWGWMQPARHALGALLLEQDRVEEAAAVYCADLGLDGTVFRPMQHPDNIWSLLGYMECLHKLGRHEDAALLQPRLDLAAARADPDLRDSCFCRVGAPCCE